MAKGGGEIEMKRVKLVAAVVVALTLVAGPAASGGSAAPQAPAYLCPPVC